MKNPNGLPTAPVLDFPKIAPITRYLPPGNEEHSIPLRRDGHQDTAAEAAGVEAANERHAGMGLSQRRFAKQLRRERMRAERSKQPLSIVFYRLPPQASDGNIHDEAMQLLDALHQASRETDIIGFPSSDSIAIICPDTNHQGVQAYVEKINRIAKTKIRVAETATFPDRLFDELGSMEHSPPKIPEYLTSEASAARKHGYFLKRPLDFLLAANALVLLAPLMLVVALTIAITSPGPIIFKQRRVGRHGIPFNCFKFRSMVTNVDDSIHREFVSALIKGQSGNANSSDGNTLPYKIQADPRVTWIGRIIRKTSIDELPQLFNVLRGEMSLVGPRPPIPYEVEDYQAWHLRRILKAMPGITGLWQVEGRSSVTFDEMVRMDLRYIQNCSLGLDIKILLKTVKVVLRCDGAA